MRIRLNFRWLLVPALLLSLQFCRAQNSVSFSFGGTNDPQDALWDLSGTYNLDLVVQQRNGNSEEMTFSFNMMEDASGHLHSPVGDVQGLTLSDNSSSSLLTVSDYIISGKVTSFGGTARARFTILLFGESGTLAGRNVDAFNGFITIDAEPDPVSGNLIGTTTFNSRIGLNFGSLGSLRGIMDFSTPLPADVDGTWNLDMQFTSLRGGEVGTATITTSTGQVLGFDVGGVLKNNTFKLGIHGAWGVPNETIPGFGSTATLLLSSDLSNLELKGTIMGQKLLVFFPTG